MQRDYSDLRPPITELPKRTRMKSRWNKYALYGHGVYRALYISTI
jgi:hypothetical protein